MAVSGGPLSIRRAVAVAAVLGLAAQFFTQANAGAARRAESDAYGISVSISSLGLSLGPIPAERASAPQEGAVETRSCTVAVGGPATCSTNIASNNGVINSGTFEVITQASTDPATDFPATLQSVMRQPPGGGALPNLWTSRSYSRIEGLSATFPVPDGTATLQAAGLESESATQVNHIDQSSISATGMRLANAQITITDLLGRSVTSQLQTSVGPNTTVFDQAGVRIVLWETPAPTVINGRATMTAMRVTVPLTGVDMRMANTASEADPAPAPAPSPSSSPEPEPSPTATEPAPEPSPSASSDPEPPLPGLPSPSPSLPPLPEPSPSDVPLPEPSPSELPLPSPSDVPLPEPSPTLPDPEPVCVIDCDYTPPGCIGGPGAPPCDPVELPTPLPSPSVGIDLPSPQPSPSLPDPEPTLPLPLPSPSEVPVPEPSPTLPEDVCLVDCDYTPPGCISGPGAPPCDPIEDPDPTPSPTPIASAEPTPQASPSSGSQPTPEPIPTMPNPGPTTPAPDPTCVVDCDYTPPGCIGGPGAAVCLPDTPDETDPNSDPDPTPCGNGCIVPPVVGCIVGPGSRGCSEGGPAFSPNNPSVDGDGVRDLPGLDKDGARPGGAPGNDGSGTGVPAYGIPTMNRSPLPFTGADARTLAAVGGWLVLIGIFLVSLAHESRPAAGALRKPRR